MTSLFKPFTLIALFFTLAACAGGGTGQGSFSNVANKGSKNTNPVYDYNDDTNPVYDFSDADAHGETGGGGQGFSPSSITTTRALQ